MTSADLGGRFWNVWAAFAGANLADGFSLVVFPLLAVALTDDPIAIAVVAMGRYLPFLLVGLPAGVILDRVDRRMASILAVGIRAVVMAGTTALVAADSATILLLTAASFVVGSGEVVTDSAVPAMIQQLVRPERLPEANSRIAAVATVTNVFLGPAVGGGLYAIEPAIGYGATATFYLVPAALLLALRGSYRPEDGPVKTKPDLGDNVEVPPEDRDADGPGAVSPQEPAPGLLGGFVSEITTGLRYVWTQPILRSLALSVALLAFAGRATDAVFVIIVTERFGFEGLEFGALVAVDSITAVISSFFVAGLVARTNHSFSMKLGMVTFATAGLLFSFSPLLVSAVASRLLYGVTEPTWNVISQTVRQRLVPSEIFGRMMTAYLFIAWGIQPFGSLFGGVVAEWVGASWVFFLSGLAGIVVLIAGRPMFSRIDRALANELPA